MPMPEANSRPYRSHKIRACDFCRKRKTRCTLELPGKACVMCRVASVNCCYEGTEDVGRQSKRPRAGSDESGETSSQNALHRFSPQPGNHKIRKQEANLVDMESESIHIVGPIMANDAQVVERYMSPKDTISQDKAQYTVYSNDSREPILYTKVSRCRPGLQPSGVAGAQQRVIIEQILGPFTEELINTYFNNIHPSFPILDRSSLQKNENQHSLMCEIYAISVLYWNSSDLLRNHPQPDMKYIWNLAVVALNEEFLGPGLFTIYSALIDLTGRPSFWLTGNVINSARTVALAHAFGLNHDPRNWKMAKANQDVRIRLWWGIVIHDRWASFAHGVPPNINKTNYNVPLPTLDDLKSTGLSSTCQLRSAETFISLCSLSEVLGDILPLVYDLQMNPQKDTAKRLRKLEVDLDHWEEDLPEWLHLADRRPLKPVVSGSSSLQLGFLAVRLLLRRIKLHQTSQDSSTTTEQLHYHRSECRKDALEVVNFTIALESVHMHEFWFPYTAYHLNSTATLLLRCAIETEDEVIKDTCLSSIKRFIDRLEKAKRDDNWDIADVCLAHCKAIVTRMTDPVEPTDGQSAETGDHQSDDLIAREGDDWARMPWIGEGMLEGFEFDMGDFWDNLGSIPELT